MIDTDKYEKHTEGPWKVLCGPELWQEAHEHDLKHAKPHNPNGGDKMGIMHLNMFFLKTPFNNAIPDHLEDDYSRGCWAEGYAMEWFVEEAANAQLMADAPLLLAEVKRLQERLDWILGDEELASYVWEKEVAYMEWKGVRLPWISEDEWGEEE